MISDPLSSQLHISYILSSSAGAAGPKPKQESECFSTSLGSSPCTRNTSVFPACLRLPHHGTAADAHAPREAHVCTRRTISTSARPLNPKYSWRHGPAWRNAGMAGQKIDKSHLATSFYFYSKYTLAPVFQSLCNDCSSSLGREDFFNVLVKIFWLWLRERVRATAPLILTTHQRFTDCTICRITVCCPAIWFYESNLHFFLCLHLLYV